MNEWRYKKTKDTQKINWFKAINIIGLLTLIVFGLTQCNYEKPTERQIAEEVRMEKQALLHDMEKMQADIDRAFTKLEESFESADFQSRAEIEKVQYELNKKSKKLGNMMMSINRTDLQDWEKVQHNTTLSLSEIEKDFQEVNRQVVSIWSQEQNS
ncbi:MAG: hypothetical protein RIA69_20795 [Cyclobacteriaceae bacterium]